MEQLIVYFKLQLPEQIVGVFYSMPGSTDRFTEIQVGPKFDKRSIMKHQFLLSNYRINIVVTT